MKTKVLTSVLALGVIGTFADEAAACEFDRIDRAVNANKADIFDQTPMQVLASGTISNGTVAPGFAFTARGATPARTGAGVYTLTLDNEAGGGACSPNALRVFVQPLTALQVAQAAKTSATVTTVTTSVGTTGVATDGTFDFLILKDPNVTT